jgi:hypothetical protein
MVHKEFNISHLEAENFNKIQEAFASGSGPGALPGAPRGTPLDSAAEIFRVLKAVEMRGFHRLQIRLHSTFKTSRLLQTSLKTNTLGLFMIK